MTPLAATATLDDTRAARKAVRRLKGEATLGDVVTETGLTQPRAEAALRDLLEQYRGHLAVGERGDLLYRFDPRFLDRDHAPAWVRFREKAWDLFKAVYKVSIAVVLVVYFLIFVALMIAAIVAANRGGDGDGGFGGGDRRGGRGIGFPNFWFWYLIWSPDWGWGRPYYGDRYDRRGEGRGRKKKGPPFYKKVFAFVFGPDRPEETRERKDRELLGLARAKRGVLSAADVVQATGMGLDDAEEELARLMVAHDGDARATEAGVVHLFPDLMISAGTSGEEAARLPSPAWRRLQPDLPVTGNRTGTNVAISALNGFNLAAAVSAPWLIFPPLGLSGPAAWIGLSVFPALFSLSFFAVPLLRRFSVARKNARRRKENVRRALLSLLTRKSLGENDAEPISERDAIRVVTDALGDPKAASKTRRALDRFVAEFDGEVEVDAEEVAHFRFPGFRAGIEAAAAIRAKTELSRDVGRIVYDSGDDAVTAGERDLETFDAELERPVGPSTGKRTSDQVDPLADQREILYLDDPERFAFRDELELAAMEQEIRARERVPA